MRSVYRESRAIGAAADAKIRRLQAMYLSASRGASARAALAQLRHGGGAARWTLEGAILFPDLGELDLEARDEARAYKALRIALELYAWHQQSCEEPMAFIPHDDEATRSFGRSCRLIEVDLEKAAGVRRKLASVESSPSVDVMEHQLRALIRLMRSKGIAVDYRGLASDLYLIQFESLREDVFMRWSCDYYQGAALKSSKDK